MPPEFHPMSVVSNRLRNHAQAAIVATTIVLIAGGSPVANASVAPRNLGRRIDEIRLKIREAQAQPPAADAPETMQFPNFPNFANAALPPFANFPNFPNFANAVLPPFANFPNFPNFANAVLPPFGNFAPRPQPGFPNFLNAPRY